MMVMIVTIMLKNLKGVFREEYMAFSHKHHVNINSLQLTFGTHRREDGRVVEVAGVRGQHLCVVRIFLFVLHNNFK